MNTEELSLYAIDSHRPIVVSPEIVCAVAFAARLGWSERTTYRFVTAVVLTDNLRDRGLWPEIMRKVKNLQVNADLAALEIGQDVRGDIE